MASETPRNNNWNNLHIRVERGSLSPRGVHHSASTIARSTKQPITPSPHTPQLPASTTCLCEDPSTAFPFPPCDDDPSESPPISSIKHIMHHNTPFYTSKSNLSLYHTKFHGIETRSPRLKARSPRYDYKLYLNRLLHSHVAFDRLFVIDFDDTLFPTSYMARKSTKTFACNPVYRAHAKRLHQNMKSLIDITLSLFDKIQSVDGKIIILTNATYGWIDDILNGYLPGMIVPVFSTLAAYIRTHDIEIISARDYYNDKYSDSDDYNGFDGETAKTECMQSVFEKYVQNSVSHKIPIVYSIGDSMYEFHAAKSAWNDVIGHKSISILQRIKFIKKPSLEMLMQELETLEELVHCDTDARLIEWIIDEKYIIDYV